MEIFIVVIVVFVLLALLRYGPILREKLIAYIEQSSDYGDDDPYK